MNEVGSGQLAVRSYREGDEEGINRMFNEVFHQNRDLSHWYWKYRDNPLGSHFISLAEFPDGRLAAHYGGYPVELHYCPAGCRQPHKIMTFHLGDKMTRREARSAGYGRSSVLARTFDHFRRSYADPSVPFGYGFGTGHSLRFGLLFLNYADVEPVPYRSIALSASKVTRTARFLGAVSGVSVDEATDIGPEWTDFFHRVAPSYRYLVARDAAYLTWRYLRRPDRRYLVLTLRRGRTLIGWGAFWREGSSVQWGDALVDPGKVDHLRLMLEYVRCHRIADGALTLEGWFPPRPLWWDRALREAGFRSEPEPRGLHLTGPVFHDTRAPEKMRDSFYYTMGDSDLF